MNVVTPDEIRAIADYELGRDAFRKRILAIKRARRIAVGDHLTFLFENHDTVLYQIQEMIRVERIVEPAAIAHEIKTYNELIPRDHELTATLLIEYQDAAVRDRKLKELLGLEKHVVMSVDGIGSTRAVFDDRQISAERLSSVHYIRFPLGDEMVEAIRPGAQVEISVDHETLHCSASLTDEQISALAEDLRA